MNCYEPSIHRVAFGIAAVALSAITFGLAVVTPSQMESTGHAVNTLAAKAAAQAPAEVVINPAHIEVVGIRESRSAHNAQPSSMAKRELQARAEPDQVTR